MKEEPIREGIYTKIGVLLTAVAFLVAWYYDARVPPPPPPPIIEKDPVESSTPPRRDLPAFPLNLTLHDGEQRSFLEDQASVAAEFNRIGGDDFLTLRVGTTEGGSVPHPVLGAGNQFPVRVAGSEYSISILSMDKSARTVEIRISRNS